MPTAREICPPYRIRVKTSRPNSSVPNQLTAEGFANSFFELSSVAEYALNGAEITSRVIRPSTIAETSARRCRLKRRQINADRLSGRTDAEKIGSGMEIVTSVISNARVEEAV